MFGMMGRCGEEALDGLLISCAGACGLTFSTLASATTATASTASTVTSVLARRIILECCTFGLSITWSSCDCIVMPVRGRNALV
jgi:hypothetical protein